METLKRLFVLFAVLTLLAAACGDDDEGVTTTTEGPGQQTTTTSGPTPMTGATPTTEAPSTPAGPSGTLTVSQEEAINGVDILQNATCLACTVAFQNIFDTLTARTADGEIVPRLAESWEQPDENTWVFHLRETATFHNGEPVTAADVAATATALRDGGYSSSRLWVDVEEIEATDDHTVTFRTSDPVGTMLTTLLLLYIAPEEAFNGTEYAGQDELIGSGPFELESFQLDDRMVLTANTDYWGEVPKLERLIFVEIPEVTAKVTAVLTGEVDIAFQLPGDQLDTLRADDNVDVAIIPSFGIYFAWFNNDPQHRTEGGPDDVNPFADKTVRQAMWHAINSEQIAATVFENIGQVATGPISSEVFGHMPQPPYEYDPELARQMLADAGYPDGFTASIDFDPSFIQSQPFALSMIDNWRDIGVTITPNEIERSVWVERLGAVAEGRGGSYDITIAPNVTFTGDADWSLGRLYTPCNGNRLDYCSEDYDRFILEAKRTTDTAARLEAYGAAITTIWEDAPSMWPIELLVNYAVNARVEGFVPVPSQIPNFATVSVSE